MSKSAAIAKAPRIHYVFMKFPVPSETFARVELRGLREAGCTVSVSTLRWPTLKKMALLREHKLEDIHVSYPGPLKWIRSVVSVAKSPILIWKICGMVFPSLAGRWKEMVFCSLLLPRALSIALEIRSRGVDHVHLFWGHYPSLVGLFLREIDSECSVSMSLGAYDLVRQSPISRILGRRAPVLTQARVNVGPISEFVDISRDEVNVVYRGIEVTDITGSGKRDAIPCVVIAERLVPDKRTIDALRAFACTLKSVPGAELSVLGDGPSRSGLEAWVRREGLGNSVRFLGHVSHKTAQDVMARSQVALSMTQNPGERLPNAVKEAMSKECAVIVASSPGIEELVEHGVNGYIVEPADCDEAARRLVELLKDNQKAMRLGQNGRRRVLSRFDIAVTTRKRLAVWFPSEKKIR